MLKVALAYLSGYMALHWVSYVFVYPDFGVTPWDPKTGLTFLTAILLGRLAFPIIFVATLVGQYLLYPYAPLSEDLIKSLLFSIIYTTSGLYFAKVTLGDRLGSIPQLLKLIVIAGITAVLYGVVVVVTVSWLHRMPSPWLLSAIITSATGDLIGTLTIVPLYLVWKSLPSVRPPDKRSYLIIAIGISVVAISSYVVFGLDSTDQFKFFYVVLLPVVAYSLLYGLTGAALSIIATDLCMIGIIYLRDVAPGTATELQILMITLSATGLLLGAVVTERSRLSLQLVESHQKLSDAQSQLLHASRVLLVNEMASAIAHEINQPLSAIRNFARTIKRLLPDKKVDRRKISALIDAAIAQVDSASAIINDTRKFVKRDTNERPSASVSDSVALCLRLLHGELKRSGAVVGLNIPADVYVLIQPVKLQQVLLNLLRNAIEALADRRPAIIEVSCSRTGDAARIEVTDSGPGIPPDLRSEMFRPFATSKETGLGLGLPLCRSIANDHGGELWIETSKPGQTTIAFTLRATTPNEPDCNRR
jgi:two-component system, LuxR family, sensor kinase FixL